MYRKHFGLDSKPFTITPDPRFLFLSDRHREALAHLLFGVGEAGGFVQLTGEVGTGKTTLCRALLEQLPETVDVALILNPKLNGQELVAAVCDELNVDYPHETQSLKVLVDCLNHHLLQSHAAGRRTILIIDEAQNLSIEVLEQIRLLTNLETTQAKLLQIILIGQPEFQELLARTELRQLAQRITARYHLGELDRDETQAYISHRLRVSGGHADFFTTGAINEVYRLSGGIPRLINVMCDRALLGAYVEDKRRVDRSILRRAAAEVAPEVQSARIGATYWPVLVAVLAVLVAAGLFFGRGFEGVATSSSDGPEPSVTSGVNAAIEAKTAAPPDVVAPESLPSEAAPVVGTDTTTAPAAESVVAGPSEFMPAEVVPVVAELGARLAIAADEGAGLRAWTGLFSLWRATLFLDDDLQPCAQAMKQGLNCLERSGNWTQLRSFDRPVMLHMIAPDGRRVPVLLRGLQGEQASIELGGEVLRVPLTDIDAHWHGQFTLLWRAPIGNETLRLGSRGGDVVWLRDLLQRIDPEEAPAVSVPQFFDAALAEQVRHFQSQHLLEPDGVVGALTLIHLNSADPASGGPRLTVTEN
ncbi:MAG TPA: AAA family ATPase [Gammaproteobacteria bacterium]|nr:AAA family ATPase [Gammaproteobacteria bacterium]